MISSLINQDHCDGILAASDAQGIGVFRALKERHIRVPEDIKVLSLTGYQMGEMLETSLTSMELPSTEIGVKSFLMLLEAINAKNAERSFSSRVQEKDHPSSSPTDDLFLFRYSGDQLS